MRRDGYLGHHEIITLMQGYKILWRNIYFLTHSEIFVIFAF